MARLLLLALLLLAACAGSSGFAPEQGALAGEEHSHGKP